MGVGISLKGIDEAIANLKYQRANTLKSRLLHAVRGLYDNEESIESVAGINAEKLITALWDSEAHPGTIKAKRKHFSSIKSSVNADLRRLYKEGKNPEGIIIGRHNVFALSDEAKDKLLAIFKNAVRADGSVTLSQIAEVLDVINEVLSGPGALADADSSHGPGKLEALGRTIQGLSDKLGLQGTPGGVSGRASEAGQGPGMVERGADPAHEADGEGVVTEAAETAPQEAEDLEEMEETEALGDVDTDHDPDEEERPGATDVEVIEGPEAVGLPAGSLGQHDPDRMGEGADMIQKANLLAKAFDGYLGTMERFYNQYVLIPAGEYMVGSRTPKREEQPEHRVKLAAFYMGKFPVTNALFEIFVEKTGHMTTAENLGYGTVYCGRFHRRMDPRTGLIKYTFHATVRDETVNGACWYQPFGPGSTLHQKRNHPVVQVSLEDAMAFAAWTGRRLPTENEWEAAARTADGRVFPWGNEWKAGACNIEEGSVADTTSVDTYAAMQNDLGIVDTLGNVLEWTSDTYEAPHHVKKSPRCQIAKGGSWISGYGIRPCSRFKVDPSAPSNILGFRCVAD